MEIANDDFLWWPVESSKTELPEEVTVLVIESLAGKRALFVPGRRATPYQAERFNEDIVVNTLWALMETGWGINPKRLIALPILTEGLGVPFNAAFHRVWPGQEIGGRCASWLKRRRMRKSQKDEKYDPFKAEAFRFDTNPIEELEEGSLVGITFDIGATGTTIEKHTESLLDLTNRFSHLIFASPCTSLEAARRFVAAATAGDLEPQNLAVVANEGLCGLDQNGTFLSFQLPGAITSPGNLALSRKCYPNPRFCHIGAGGLRANSQEGYKKERERDEKTLGKLPHFTSLEEAMKSAKVAWPEDFG